jgi:hypothetical protein
VRGDPRRDGVRLKAESSSYADGRQTSSLDGVVDPRDRPPEEVGDLMHGEEPRRERPGVLLGVRVHCRRVVYDTLRRLRSKGDTFLTPQDSTLDTGPRTPGAPGLHGAQALGHDVAHVSLEWEPDREKAKGAAEWASELASDPELASELSSAPAPYLVEFGFLAVADRRELVRLTIEVNPALLDSPKRPVLNASVVRELPVGGLADQARPFHHMPELMAWAAHAEQRRRAGLPADPPPVAGPTDTRGRRGRPPLGPDHLRAVADVYRDAVARRLPPTKAVEERWGRPRSTVNWWIRRARQQGYLPPRPAGAPKSVADLGSINA